MNFNGFIINNINEINNNYTVYNFSSHDMICIECSVNFHNCPFQILCCMHYIIFFMAHRAIVIIAFPRVRTIYIYVYISESTVVLSM